MDLNVILAKKIFKNAYIKYRRFLDTADCGEGLILNISSTASDLCRDMEKKHYQFRQIDPKCPDMEYCVFRRDDEGKDNSQKQ